MDSGRVEAFSDGVFAIAITLLVLDLRVSEEGPLLHQLLAAWPHYFAYVVSFLTIGIMWMNHYTILAHVKRVDRPLLVLNLLLLMGIVAVPFPTTLVAEHLRDADGKVATVTYGLVMIVISAGFAALWVYVVPHVLARGGGAAGRAAPVGARLYPGWRRLRGGNPDRGVLVAGRRADHLRRAGHLLPVRAPAQPGRGARRREAACRLTAPRNMPVRGCRGGRAEICATGDNLHAYQPTRTSARTYLWDVSWLP
jgi:hypothetical protein